MTRTQARTRARQAGFTLIELMITVAIVAILARIAYGSYQGSIVKTRRAKAEACLVEQAQWMERYYTTKFTYAGATNPPPSSCSNDTNIPYTFAFSGTPDAVGFTLSAAPTTIQSSRDGKCATLTLDNKGVRGESGTGTVADCW